MRLLLLPGINFIGRTLQGLLVLSLIILVNITFTQAQDTILVRNQALHRSREYISIDVQPLFRTNTKIDKTTDRDVLSRLNSLGFSAGVDYSRVSRSGFTGAAGIHFRMIPVAYKFNIDFEDLPGGGPSITNFGERSNNLSNGHFYLPFQAGYTFQKAMGKWVPSVLAGMSLSRVHEYSLGTSASYRDDNDIDHPIQQLSIYFPEKNPWLNYTLNLRGTKTLKKGNQIFLGLNASFSGVSYNYGIYDLYQGSGKQSGTFNDTGSYIALQFGFSFVRKYLEPEKYTP